MAFDSFIKQNNNTRRCTTKRLFVNLLRACAGTGWASMSSIFVTSRLKYLDTADKLRLCWRMKPYSALWSWFNRTAVQTDQVLHYSPMTTTIFYHIVSLFFFLKTSNKWQLFEGFPGRWTVPTAKNITCTKVAMPRKSVTRMACWNQSSDGKSRRSNNSAYDSPFLRHYQSQGDIIRCRSKAKRPFSSVILIRILQRCIGNYEILKLSKTQWPLGFLGYCDVCTDNPMINHFLSSVRAASLSFRFFDAHGWRFPVI